MRFSNPRQGKTRGKRILAQRPGAGDAESEETPAAIVILMWPGAGI